MGSQVCVGADVLARKEPSELGFPKAGPRAGEGYTAFANTGLRKHKGGLRARAPQVLWVQSPDDTVARESVCSGTWGPLTAL